jgi:opacity protein-like surface antigen
MSARLLSWLGRAALASVWLVPTASVAAQPPTTRVATGTSLHARCDPSSPVRQPLRAGDVVEVEGIIEGWVTVRVVETGEQGCVLRKALEAIPAGAIDPGRPAAPAQAGRPLRVSVFGYGGLLNLSATKSFDAILGDTSGPVYGGGGQVSLLTGPLRNVFFAVDFSQFEETGERVFVNGDDVFKLGTPNTLTLWPLEFTVGYRYPIVVRDEDGRQRTSPFVPYGGGGIGVVRFQETSTFGDPGEDVDERFTSYHVLGGLEVPIWGGLGVAIEGHYRWVPDGLGSGGVSQAFNETDLGGATFRVKVGFGF